MTAICIGSRHSGEDRRGMYSAPCLARWSWGTQLSHGPQRGLSWQPSSVRNGTGDQDTQPNHSLPKTALMVRVLLGAERCTGINIFWVVILSRTMEATKLEEGMVDGDRGDDSGQPTKPVGAATGGSAEVREESRELEEATRRSGCGWAQGWRRTQARRRHRWHHKSESLDFQIDGRSGGNGLVEVWSRVWGPGVSIYRRR